MKLGIADRLGPAELSKRFLWWDPDMVPVAPVELFDRASGAPVLAVGGKRIRAYARAFGRLAGGGALARAPDGSSFVAHAMVGASRPTPAHPARAALRAPGPSTAAGRESGRGAPARTGWPLASSPDREEQRTGRLG